jgi:hypothetical protein
MELLVLRYVCERIDAKIMNSMLQEFIRYVLSSGVNVRNYGCFINVNQCALYGRPRGGVHGGPVTSFVATPHVQQESIAFNSFRLIWKIGVF